MLTYQPQIFTASGRIGRLRYLAYSLLSMVILMGLMGIASLFADSGLILITVPYIVFLVFTLVLGKRRLNDMDYSGWFILLNLIPLVNILVALWLVFGKGTSGSNRFGSAPNANPLSVKIFGLVGPFIFVIGILAAIALPAYQDYVERAKAASIR
ncbi:MAG: DUF805 domain-containing protein [Gammaproteobacteria bacterium]|nr:DUF805 domain-containing protein [Gammaproteobacteria bacterium]